MPADQLKINQNTYNIYKHTASLSIAAIFLLGVTFLQPTSFTNNSYAEGTSASTTVDTSVTVEPVIEIWTTDTNNKSIDTANITTDPDGSIVSTTVRAHVSTSNVTGYTLSIQSSSTDAKMIHEDSSITKTIDPLTGEGTSTNDWKTNKDLNNMWGYSIGDNDSYLGVPGRATSTTIDSTNAANNDNYTDVTFAAKADTSLPAGTYTDTVIFSAVANPDTPTELADNLYMQDVTQEMCANTEEYEKSGKTYTLIDSRDNSDYQVRKLKDGNCWMVQNLRMTKDTLSANSHSPTLTSSDTDITSISSPSSFEMPDNQSWSGSGADHLLKGAADATKLPVGSIDGEPASGEIATARGAYYSWCTATADCTNDVSTSVHQENSICPKNWDLPGIDGSGLGSDTNMYYRLYNDTSKGYSGDYTDFMTAFNVYYPGITSYYFAGYYNFSYVVGPDTYGHWWSSTSHVSDAVRAWGLYVGTSYIYPEYSSGATGIRPYGRSIRCVLES